MPFADCDYKQDPVQGSLTELEQQGITLCLETPSPLPSSPTISKLPHLFKDCGRTAAVKPAVKRPSTQ